MDQYPNVRVIGINRDSLNDEEKEILDHQISYCQAMVDGNLEV